MTQRTSTRPVERMALPVRSVEAGFQLIARQARERSASSSRPSDSIASGGLGRPSR